MATQVAGVAEALAQHGEQLGVVGRSVPVAEDGAHRVAGQAENGGSGLLGEADIDARHLQLGGEAAEVPGGRLDLLADPGEGVRAQRDGRPHVTTGSGTRMSSMAARPVDPKAHPAARVGHGDVTVLTVAPMGGHDAGRGVLEREPGGELGPGLGLVGTAGERRGRRGLANRVRMVCMGVSSG